jgi:hypothetical protein
MKHSKFMKLKDLAGRIITVVALASLVCCNTPYKKTENGFKSVIASLVSCNTRYRETENG